MSQRFVFFSHRTVKAIAADRARAPLSPRQLGKHIAACDAFDAAWRQANREAVAQAWDRELVQA